MKPTVALTTRKQSAKTMRRATIGSCSEVVRTYDSIANRAPTLSLRKAFASRAIGGNGILRRVYARCQRPRWARGALLIDGFPRSSVNVAESSADAPLISQKDVERP